jgi:hypothetical protein
MTGGDIMQAFVKLLEAQERAAVSYQNGVRARLQPIEYELLRAAAELSRCREILAEARVLAQALADGSGYYIQPDGSVRVDGNTSKFRAPFQEGLL